MLKITGEAATAVKFPKLCRIPEENALKRKNSWAKNSILKLIFRSSDSPADKSTPQEKAPSTSREKIKKITATKEKTTKERLNKVDASSKALSLFPWAIFWENIGIKAVVRAPMTRTLKTKLGILSEAKNMPKSFEAP
jgi:hypothetical protein